VETVELLRRGQQLELEQRWGDAISYYEEAVRQFPEDRRIEQRFEVARLHYDLGRRYNDQSFCTCVQQLSAEQALDLYHEVLLKIQAHYVEAPDWKDLVARGLAGLDVALSEPTFEVHNGAQLQTAAIDEYRRELQKFFATQAIISRSDARDAVSWAAQAGHQRLGIAATAVILEFLCGATNSLDPYSAYLTPNQLNEVYSQIEGNFVGIGVELKPLNGTLNVVRAIPGSPAQQSGILAGDQIVAIGERWVRDCPPDQAANLLQGEAGTTVDVTVVTGAQPPRGPCGSCGNASKCPASTTCEWSIRSRAWRISSWSASRRTPAATWTRPCGNCIGRACGA
jgi:carboxyl-terminal processing protease